MSKLKDFVERIEAENELFNSMSKAEKRVRIAEDCLERIALQTFEPVRGRIFSKETEKILKSINKDVKTTVNSSVQCSACAKGGLFMSYVGRVNKVKSCEIDGGLHVSSNEHIKLFEIFTPIQLSKIEYAFESFQMLRTYWIGNYQHSINFTNIEEAKIEAFYDKYDTDTNRMIAICENIIENKGTFKP